MMPTPNPEHLLEQAERLVQRPPSGPPRQADVRRAISAAYYAVFHAIVTAAANQLVGKANRTTLDYGLAYHSINHQWLRQLCAALSVASPSGKIGRHAPDQGFGHDLQAVCVAVLELQESRHDADYDPLLRVKTADALLAVRTARTAIRRFDKAAAAKRKRFLTLLPFPPR